VIIAFGPTEADHRAVQANTEKKNSAELTATGE